MELYSDNIPIYFFQVRVDVNGEDTSVVFDKVLTNLARTAPPVPGFRKQKGGDSFNSVTFEYLIKIFSCPEFSGIINPYKTELIHRQNKACKFFIGIG